MKVRNPAVVLFWSFGLFMLIHTTQYLGYLAASVLSGVDFESIISGEFENHLTMLGQGLVAALIGIPVIFIVAKYLWRRPWDWMRFHFDSKLLAYGFIFGLGLPFIILAAVFLFGSVQGFGTPTQFHAGELLFIIIRFFGYVGFFFITAEVFF